MEEHSASQTSVSLLADLRRDPADPAAWSRFVQRYGRKIYGWCRQWHLQDADAQDVTQNVLTKLVAQMRTFAYDPSQSFRAWLKTLTHHAWRDFVDSRERAVNGSGDSKVLEMLLTLEAGQDLVHQLEETYDCELLEMASVRVRLRVAPHTWEAFRLTALESLSGAAAAERLGMQVAAVYMAKSNVQKLLRDEIRRLEKPGPE